MARRKSTKTKRPIESYRHADKERVNNPPVGLVTPDTDPDAGPRTYAYDPHLDPQLHWSGKAEHTSFEVPTVSLHVHERIDPRTIVEAVRRQPDPDAPMQLSLFQTPQENPPIRQAIEFYRHKHGWSNRLVAGDSLLVMNSLLEKEGLAGKVQMIYIDPPYGIKYGSNFQPFVNKRDVKDGKDEDLTAEPEQIRAFRDTWELGIHSYLSYLRDRLLLARELLHESGSVFVQIGDENVHHVRELMDEVFRGNFVSIIPFRKKTMPLGAKYLDSMNDYIIWYGKEKETLKYNSLFLDYDPEGKSRWTWYETLDGERKTMTTEMANNHKLLPVGARVFRLVSLRAPGYSPENDFSINYKGEGYFPPKGGSWITGREGMQRLIDNNRLQPEGDNISYTLFADDFPLSKLTNFWVDTTGPQKRQYVVETDTIPIQRCLLMTTDPGDLVLDPTCGSGTTAYVAEQWGRRWITCDTSRVALTLARTRLMTAVYDYYELAHPQEGVGSGFRYKTVPHVTLKSIANDEPPTTETLYDQPFVDRKITRVSGPFTVEAVPAPAVRSVDDLLPSPTSPPELGGIGGGQTPRWPAPARRCARPNGATSCSRPACAARPASTSALPAWSRCPAAAGCTPTARPAPAPRAPTRCARMPPPTTRCAPWSPLARSTPPWNSGR